MIALSAQISALRALVTAGRPDRLVRGGIVTRRAEGELMHERLAAALRTLEAIAEREDEVRELLRKPRGEGL